MRRDHAKAREWSDRYLQLANAPYYAVGLATDGLLLIFENRRTDANQRFNESLERLSDIYPQHDEDYVRGYSQLWLSIIASAESRTDFEQLGGFVGLAAMRDELESGPARKWLKRWLPLPTRDRLDLWKDSKDTDVLKVPLVGASFQRSDFWFDF